MDFRATKLALLITSIARLVFGVPIGSKKYGVKHNKNAIERHNEDYRQRYKVTRGFKDPESEEAFTELRGIAYDFVRPHQTLGKTPAEAAGLNVVANEADNLLALIIFLRLPSPILFLSFLMEQNPRPLPSHILRNI